MSAAGHSGRGSSRALILCACLAQVIIVLDTTIVAVALPDAQADLGFADSGRQWTITAYTLAFGSLLLVGGALSQRLGVRRAFLVGLAGFGAASLVAGIATSLEVLLAARVAQGVFAALLAPTNLSLMNTAFPDARDRAGAFAVFGSVAGAGAALGLVLGGVLTEFYSWRACFLVNLPLVALAVLVALRILRGAPGPVLSHGQGGQRPEARWTRAVPVAESMRGFACQARPTSLPRASPDSIRECASRMLSRSKVRSCGTTACPAATSSRKACRTSAGRSLASPEYAARRTPRGRYPMG